MVNNRGRVLALKHITLAACFILLFVLQSTPGFLSFWGIRPILLIPAAVALAMYEGGFSGGLYGALAGMLCDLGSFSVYGLYSLLLLVCATGTGLLAFFLMRRTMSVCLLLTACVALLCALLRFYFDYGLWGYEGISMVFWEQSMPTTLFTILCAPFFFWLFGKVEIFFEAKINT